MEPTNAFMAMAVATKPAKAAVTVASSSRVTAAPTLPPPKPRRIEQPARQMGKTAAQKVNPVTAASGVPRAMRTHPERQNDGNRTQQYSKPVKGGGLAERQPAPQPHANSRDARSGLEGAMAGLADQLHPRGRPKSTQRRK